MSKRSRGPKARSKRSRSTPRIRAGVEKGSAEPERLWDDGLEADLRVKAAQYWTTWMGESEPCELMLRAAQIHSTSPGAILLTISRLLQHQYVDATDVQNEAPDAPLGSLEDLLTRAINQARSIAFRTDPDFVAALEAACKATASERAARRQWRAERGTNWAPPLLRRLRQAHPDGDRLTYREIARLMLLYSPVKNIGNPHLEGEARVDDVEKWARMTANKDKQRPTPPSFLDPHLLADRIRSADVTESDVTPPIL